MKLMNLTSPLFLELRRNFVIIQITTACLFLFSPQLSAKGESFSPFAFDVEQMQQDQEQPVRGTVTNQDGEPVPGVSVTVQGTTKGTITDSNGNYELTGVSENATLLYSFIGMVTQELMRDGRAVINGVLSENIKGLDEVVVVGYGTQKKSDITGSVVSINTEALEKSTRVSIEQMMQGVAAWLNITVNGTNAEGSSDTMLIRGQNSITASNNPLIIMDGIPYAGNLSELNPKDIASIEVLKDASSAAIYGARGANGVILITTKMGKSGQLNVNYEGAYAIDQIVNVPDMMDGATFYETKVDRGVATTAIEDEGNASGRSTDWIDLVTQTGERQKHNLSFSGGNDMTKFYLSFSLDDTKGVAVNDEFKRYTLRLNLEQELLPWITFKTNTQYGYYDRSGNDGDFGDAFRMNPLGFPFNEDGSIRMLTSEDDVYGQNPLLPTLNIESDITRRFISNNSLTFDFPFAKGLSYKLNTG